MKNIKIASIIFVFILFFFLMFDRISMVRHYDIVVRDNVYLLGLSVVIIQILLNRIVRPSPYVIFSLVTFIYLACQFIFEDITQLSNGNQTITILVELSLLIGVTYAAWLYTGAISGFDKSTQKILTDLAFNLKSVDQARNRIDSEIDRSRRYNRPLSIIIVQPDKTFTGQTIDLPVEQLYQKHIAREFFLNNLGKIILNSKRSHDLVLRLNNSEKLVLLCPETSLDDATSFINNMTKDIKTRMGTEVQSGVAAFPDDCTNFDELVARAEERIEDLLTSHQTTVMIRRQQN